jgi:hypothetical protein
MDQRPMTGGRWSERRSNDVVAAVANGADAMSSREALEIATRGGRSSSRDDCGADRLANERILFGTVRVW